MRAAFSISRSFGAAVRLFGLTRKAIVVACGTTCISRSSRVDSSSWFRMLTPVTVAPGRLRLGTRPTATGSLLPANATGMVVVAAFAARLAARQIGCQPRQSVELTVGPAKLKRHVSVLDKVSLGQALPKCGHGVGPVGGGAGVQNPNYRHARLLRVRYNRPRRHRTAEQRDELAPLHSHHLQEPKTDCRISNWRGLNPFSSRACIMVRACHIALSRL